MQWYDIIFLIIGLIVIVLALLQGGKSEGASSAIIGGGGMNIFVKTKERGSEKVITWLTFSFAIVFMFIAIIVSVVHHA